MKKLFFLAAAAIFAFTACEKQQSELNLEGNVKKATISGQLVYLQDHAGAATEEIAVANQRVYFEVAGTTYSGTAASGNLYFAGIPHIITFNFFDKTNMSMYVFPSRRKRHD